MPLQIGGFDFSNYGNQANQQADLDLRRRAQAFSQYMQQQQMEQEKQRLANAMRGSAPSQQYPVTGAARSLPVGFDQMLTGNAMASKVQTPTTDIRATMPAQDIGMAEITPNEDPRTPYQQKKALAELAGGLRIKEIEKRQELDPYEEARLKQGSATLVEKKRAFDEKHVLAKEGLELNAAQLKFKRDAFGAKLEVEKEKNKNRDNYLYTRLAEWKADRIQQHEDRIDSLKSKEELADADRQLKRELQESDQKFKEVQNILQRASVEGRMNAQNQTLLQRAAMESGDNRIAAAAKLLIARIPIEQQNLGTDPQTGEYEKLDFKSLFNKTLQEISSAPAPTPPQAPQFNSAPTPPVSAQPMEDISIRPRQPQPGPQGPGAPPMLQVPAQAPQQTQPNPEDLARRILAMPAAQRKPAFLQLPPELQPAVKQAYARIKPNA